MKAVVLNEYGAPEVLALEEVAKPEPIPTEVQVRVHAAGVNPVDFKTRAGKGMAGLLGEPPVRLGWDVSGVVSAVSAWASPASRSARRSSGCPGSRARPAPTPST